MKNLIAIAIVVALLSGGANFLVAQKKSTAVALGLSIGTTIPACWFSAEIGSPELFVISLVLLPSAGHYYARQVTPACIFTGARTAVVVGGLLLMEEAFQEDPSAAGLVVTPVALGVFAACAIISVIDWALVPTSVQRYNESLQLKPEIDLNEKSYGIGFVYRF